MLLIFPSFGRIRSLSIVLQDAEVISYEQSLREGQQAEIHHIMDGCHNVLTALEKSLDENVEVASSGGCFNHRVGRMWKRLKWEPDDIRELQGRIASNVALLHAFLG